MTVTFTFSTAIQLLSISLALRASGQVINDFSIPNPTDTFSLKQNKSKEEHTETYSNQAIKNVLKSKKKYSNQQGKNDK